MSSPAARTRRLLSFWRTRCIATPTQQYNTGYILTAAFGAVWPLWILLTQSADGRQFIKHNVTFTFCHLAFFPVAAGLAFRCLLQTFSFGHAAKIVPLLGVIAILLALACAGRPDPIEIKEGYAAKATSAKGAIAKASKELADHERRRDAKTEAERPAWEEKRIELQDRVDAEKEAYLATIPPVISLFDAFERGNGVLELSILTTATLILLGVAVASLVFHILIVASQQGHSKWCIAPWYLTHTWFALALMCTWIPLRIYADWHIWRTFLPLHQIAAVIALAFFAILLFAEKPKRLDLAGRVIYPAGLLLVAVVAPLKSETLGAIEASITEMPFAGYTAMVMFVGGLTYFLGYAVATGSIEFRLLQDEDKK